MTIYHIRALLTGLITLGLGAFGLLYEFPDSLPMSLLAMLLCLLCVFFTGQVLWDDGHAIRDMQKLRRVLRKLNPAS